MKKIANLAAIVALGLLNACAEKPAPAPSPDQLILLTKSPEGNSEASFLTADNLEHCEQRAAGAREVFPAADIIYVGHYCVKSEVNFEPFAHGSGENATYVFKLAFSKDSAWLRNATPYPSIAACAKAIDNGTEKGASQLCVVSTQNIIN